jgi:hypothetical protein
MSKTYIRYDKKILIKLSSKQKTRALMLAKIYTNGNLSKFVRYCLENYIPEIPKKSSSMKLKRAPHKGPQKD